MLHDVIIGQRVSFVAMKHEVHKLCHKEILNKRFTWIEDKGKEKSRKYVQSVQFKTYNVSFNTICDYLKWRENSWLTSPDANNQNEIWLSLLIALSSSCRQSMFNQF